MPSVSLNSRLGDLSVGESGLTECAWDGVETVQFRNG